LSHVTVLFEKIILPFERIDHINTLCLIPARTRLTLVNVNVAQTAGVARLAQTLVLVVIVFELVGLARAILAQVVQTLVLFGLAVAAKPTRRTVAYVASAGRGDACGAV
jgi:hypothetical protein